MKIADIEEYFDRVYPVSLRSAWDRDGLMVCPNRNREVGRIVTCLDVTFSVIERAKEIGAELIVSHHPLIFSPLESIQEQSVLGRKIMLLLKNDISVLSLHTRFDAAPNGLNQAFAKLLRLTKEEGTVLSEEEPYIGGIGLLDEPLCPAEFARRVSAALAHPVRLYSADKSIVRVGYCCGSGKDFVPQAQSVGAHAFVSGDISYHVAQAACEAGMSVIDCGHHASEKTAADLLRSVLLELSPALEIDSVTEAIGGEIIGFSDVFC